MVNSATDYSRSQLAASALLEDEELSESDTTAVCPSSLPLKSFWVPAHCAGQRLDKVLALLLPDYSRNRLQAWVEEGAVTLDGQAVKNRQMVCEGQQIQVNPRPLAEESAFLPEALDLDVIYEDAAILVINKPAGLVVHPAAGNWSGTLLNGLLHRDPAATHLPRAGIVHRLDKDTSGLMVVARTLEAQTDLVRQLQARTVKRTYLALVWGKVPPAGTVDAPIGRDVRERTRMAVVAGNAGKPARTHFTWLAGTVYGGASLSWVRCDLESGRTHQIRVHMESIGHPLVGDPVYTRMGKGQRRPSPVLSFPRQALHAYRLGLLHPVTRQAMSWEAPIAADMQTLLTLLGVVHAA